VRELGPGGLGEVQRLDARQRLTPALGSLGAQPDIDLLLGHALELAVVVEQTHSGLVLAAASRRDRDGRYRRPGRHYWPRPETRLVPGPWITTNQKVKAIAQKKAVKPNTRPMTPVRWSWPAARRTRIQALSSWRRIASAPKSIGKRARKARMMPKKT